MRKITGETLGDRKVMEKIDRRVKRTNKQLQEALVALTLEKGYDAVTIREITRRAEIGYATFFRHYPDKDSLLADVLESMKDDFIELMQPFSIAAEPVRTGALIFEYVQANRDLCRVLLNSTETMAVLKPLQQIALQEGALAEMRPGDGHEQGAASRVPVDVGAYHLMTSLVWLIRWWLDNDMPYPPERMGEIAAELIIKPVLNALRQA
jgi:AcrR family transcriptional regulator